MKEGVYREPGGGKTWKCRMAGGMWDVQFGRGVCRREKYEWKCGKTCNAAMGEWVSKVGCEGRIQGIPEKVT